MLQSWGLGYERLRELNERIILMSLPAVGSDGPWSHYVGYASTTEAMAGLPALCGYDGDGPILQTPSIADPLAGLNGAVALAMALYDREVTGQGQRIEVAHLEAAIPLIGEAFMDYVMNGRVRERHGNGDPTVAPNGCFPCAGDDRWVVVSVHTDDEWAALAGVIDQPELASDPRFATREARVANVGDVEAIVAAWTSQRSPREAMDALQAGGVIAAALNNEADLLDDPQVRRRGRLRDDRPRARRPAPVPEHHGAAVGDARARSAGPRRPSARTTATCCGRCWGSRSR